MARRKPRAAAEEGHENVERWLLTYADMITLLMVLFIVLFAISQVDQKKFDKLHDGLAQSFGAAKLLDGSAGILQGSTKQAPTPNDPRAAEEALAQQQQAALAARREVEDMNRIRQRITAALAAKGLADAVQFQTDERGLVVNVVTDRVLFDVGDSTLRHDGGLVLDAIAPALVGLPNHLTVEGHTDNQPIHGGRFPTNWELSTERATTVLRYLIGRGVTARNVSAAGYADQRPIVPNSSPGQQARNRRVAIVVMSTQSTVTAGVPAPTPLAPIPGA